MSTSNIIASVLPSLPATGLPPRYGAGISFAEDVSMSSRQEATSEVAINTVRSLGHDNQRWYAEGLSTYYFATETDRDAFITLWNGFPFPNGSARFRLQTAKP